LHFVAKLLALLKFVVQALNVPLPLALKVCVVALEGVHFAAEARLVLLVEDRSLLVICSEASLNRVVLGLSLVEVLLGLIQLPPLTVDLKVLFFQGNEQRSFLFRLRGGILGLTLRSEAQLVGLLLHDLDLKLELVALSGQLSPGAALLVHFASLSDNQIISFHFDLVPFPPQLSDFILALSKAPLVVVALPFEPSLDLNFALVVHFKLQSVILLSQSTDLFFRALLEVSDLSLSL